MNELGMRFSCGKLFMREFDISEKLKNLLLHVVYSIVLLVLLSFCPRKLATSGCFTGPKWQIFCLIRQGIEWLEANFLKFELKWPILGHKRWTGSALIKLFSCQGGALFQGNAHETYNNLLLIICFPIFLIHFIYFRECTEPKLLKFGGRAKDYSPRARFRALMG